jgi:hypothetical protein
MAALMTNPRAVRPGKFLAQMAKMAEGLQAIQSAGFALPINGTMQTPAQMYAAMQGWIAMFNAVDQAEQQHKDALNKRWSITVAARTFYKGLTSVLKQQFGPQSAVLASFGIPTDKPLAMTTQQKLVAAAKRLQTRKVRGTKGKKQNAAITVVGNPAIQVASDGTLQISPPPVNLPAAPTPPSGSNSGNGSSGNTPPAG